MCRSKQRHQLLQIVTEHNMLTKQPTSELPSSRTTPHECCRVDRPAKAFTLPWLLQMSKVNKSKSEL
jgi:hypothetical protein